DDVDSLHEVAPSDARPCWRGLQAGQNSTCSSGEHPIGAIDGFRFRPEMLLDVDAEVRDALLAVFQPRLVVGGADGFRARVAQHAEHGIWIELFLDGRGRGRQITRSQGVFLLLPPRVLLLLTQLFLLAEPRLFLLLQRRLTPLPLLERALPAL